MERSTGKYSNVWSPVRVVADGDLLHRVHAYFHHLPKPWRHAHNVFADWIIDAMTDASVRKTTAEQCGCFFGQKKIYMNELKWSPGA